MIKKIFLNICLSYFLTFSIGFAEAAAEEEKSEDASGWILSAATDAVLLDGLVVVALGARRGETLTFPLLASISSGFFGYLWRNVCDHTFWDGEPSGLCASTGGMLGYSLAVLFDGERPSLKIMAIGACNYFSYFELEKLIGGSYEEANPFLLFAGLFAIEFADARFFGEQNALQLGAEASLWLFLSLTQVYPLLPVI